jgi:hypothetical protein
MISAPAARIEKGSYPGRSRLCDHKALCKNLASPIHIADDEPGQQLPVYAIERPLPREWWTA